MTDKWQTIETAPNDVERCFLWCSDLHEGRDGEQEPRGTVFGRIRNGIPRGEGMSGDWKFTHCRPLFDPPDNPSLYRQTGAAA